MNKDSEETVLAIVIRIISIAFVFILCFSIAGAKIWHDKNDTAI